MQHLDILIMFASWHCAGGSCNSQRHSIMWDVELLFRALCAASCFLQLIRRAKLWLEHNMPVMFQAADSSSSRCLPTSTFQCDAAASTQYPAEIQLTSCSFETVCQITVQSLLIVPTQGFAGPKDLCARHVPVNVPNVPRLSRRCYISHAFIPIPTDTFA